MTNPPKRMTTNKYLFNLLPPSPSNTMLIYHTFLLLVVCVVLLPPPCRATAPDDLYQILELSRDATDRDIKRSFRQLALKYHPDKNKDPDAPDKFQKIAKAYEVLSDPSKKKFYDMTGSPDGLDGFHSGGGSPIDLSAIFVNFDQTIKTFTEKMYGGGDNAFSFDKMSSSFNFDSLFGDLKGAEDLFASFGKKVKPDATTTKQGEKPSPDSSAGTKEKSPPGDQQFSQSQATHNKYDKAHNTKHKDSDNL